MNDKSVTSFGNTTVAQTAHEIDLKVGPDIKIPPEVTFKDVKNETVLGDPNNMHITTGHFNLSDLKKGVKRMSKEDVALSLSVLALAISIMGAVRF